MFENMAELLATDNDLPHSHPLVRLLDWMEKTCADIADRVMTPYEKARSRLIEAGIPAKKIVFIANGPDEDEFLSKIEDIDRARTQVQTDGFRLVTHGSLLERYGIQTLIQAVGELRDRIPELQVDVVGFGEYEEDLKELASNLNLDDVVTFVGPVPFTEMAATLLKADVGVVPYWLDGMPNKLMEYLLLGIPAIVSDFPTMRLYFGDDAIRYVPAERVDALAEAIEDLYLHPEKRQALAMNGMQQYQNKLAWPKAKWKYLGVYGVEPPPEEVEETKRSTNWLSFVLGQSRGPRNAITRLPTIVGRFGVTPYKSEHNLDRLLEITDKYSVKPTLPVTAATASRHPDVVRRLEDRGVEIAAHGLVHNDYASLSREEQFDQVGQAREELESLGFKIRGWRCPYSRWNSDTLDALRANGFEYDATPVYEWPAFQEENIRMSPDEQADYQRLCRLFNVRDARTRAVLPTGIDSLVQIPMSIPQDEDMVDRLHLDGETMSRVWRRMLHDSHSRRELFVICLHPERASLCAEPLEATLDKARSLGDVWIPTLIEVAIWWQERGTTKVEVDSSDQPGSWNVKVCGPERVVTRCGAHAVKGSGTASVEQPRKPVIASGSQWPEETITRVREAGYVVERKPEGNVQYALHLQDVAELSDQADAVLRNVEKHEGSLVRLQPWPSGARSCLSITGDIDALTLVDFAMRLKEFK
jgi:peptidoglycan/xylan/chitin deacetylase (PgdA/CDA1 family)